MPAPINGSNGNDTIFGTDGDDRILGKNGDDSIFGDSGDDTIFGGNGFDTAVFSGSVSDYVVSDDGGNTCIVSNLNGTDTLKQIEAIQFDDAIIYKDGRNNDPFAIADFATVSEDNAIDIDVLSNDLEFDGQALAVISVTGGSLGSSISINGAGGLTYIPGLAFQQLAVGETATDTVSYTVSDGQGGTDVQTVTITILGENDAPTIGAAITASADEDDPGFSVDLLAGAGDIDTSDTLNVTGLVVISGDGSGIVLDGNSLSVDPSAYSSLTQGQSEVVVFSYFVDDGNGGQTSQTATVTISGVDVLPLFTAQNDIVDFNLITGGTYVDGSQYDALNGDDLVYLPNTVIEAALAGYDLNATFQGGRGSDTIYGSTEGDRIFGGSPSNPNTPGGVAGGGHDVLFGLGGDDTLNAQVSSSSYIDGGTGNDTIFGTQSGPDTLIGGSGDDSILGVGGDDSIDGGSGNDTLNGSLGDDTIVGGLGADDLIGSEGADQLFGGDGDDTLSGQDGNDFLDGGAGDDSLNGGFGNSGDDDDTVFGGDGNDIIRVQLGNNLVDGGMGDDTINGGSGADTIFGGEGNDRILAGNGNDLVRGGDGIDVLRGDRDDDTIYGDAGNDNVAGGDGNDQVFGGDDDDFATGGLGDDLIDGGTGNDIVRGNDGNDTLLGGDGDDTLTGGDGFDFLTGGQDADTFVFGAGDVVTDYVDGTDVLDMSVFGFSDVSELQIIQDGSNVTIGDAFVSMTVDSALVGIFDNSDFIF